MTGDNLDLDSLSGLGTIVVSAAGITVTGVNTAAQNGSVSLWSAGALTVTPGAVIDSGYGTIDLEADVNADHSGNSNTAALAIESGAVVVSSNSSAGAITLRGYNISIDSSANPALVARPAGGSCRQRDGDDLREPGG